MERLLTRDVLIEESVEYNPETGEFFWKLDRPLDHFKTMSSYRRWITMFSGKKIFNPDDSCSNNTSYNKLNICGFKYKAHRVAWFLYYKEWPVGEVDHVNRDGLDNRIENLRDVDKSTNLRNTGMRENNTSGYRGVSFRKDVGKWVARGSCKVKDENTRLYLGLYDTFEEAKSARVAWEVTQGNFQNTEVKETD